MAREKKAIAITPRRARVRRARQIRLALLMGMAAVILVGLIGLGVWLLLGPKPEWHQPQGYHNWGRIWLRLSAELHSFRKT